MKRRFPLSRILQAALVALAALRFSAAAVTPDEGLAACLACHGEKGQSIVPEVPSLGAQPEFFLSVQLLMFRERIRRVEPMTTMMKGLSDGDLRRMAAALANLPAPRLAGQREDYLVKALREYKSNARRAYDAWMADVIFPLTDADILDLAHYLARLR